MHSFLEKFKNHDVPMHAAKEVNPHRHWVILLKVFFGSMFVLAFGSLYLLFQIKNEQFTPSVTTVEQKETILKESLISSISSSMQKKMDRTASLIAHPLSYQDPSK